MRPAGRGLDSTALNTSLVATAYRVKLVPSDIYTQRDSDRKSASSMAYRIVGALQIL